MNGDHGLITKSINATNIVWAALLYFILALGISFWRAPRYPTTIPWVGHGSGWFAAVLNTVDGFKNSKRWMHDGYHKHNKNGRPFVLPPGLGATAEVVIPRVQIPWLIDQPDEVLSPHAASYDILSGDYLFAERIILQDPYHERAIHKHLARNMNAMLPEIDSKVCREADDFFGKDKSFHSVNVLDVFMKLAPRITNVMLVGQPLCENKDFLHHVAGFVDNVIRGFVVFPLTPLVLRPIVGRLLGLVSKYHAWKASKYTLPIIKQRLAMITGDPEKGIKGEETSTPNDFITWQIKTAMSEGRTEECDPWRISLRIMPLDFAAIHTTAMTGHAALLDILSAEPNVLERLREEAERVYKEEGRQWTKKGLAKLYRMDSAIRESQRFSSFAQTFLHRKVLAKDGIIGPDGVHYAYGSILSAAWWATSNDDELFPRADKYDAFRYSRDREAYEAKPAEERDQAETLKLKQSAIVTTSDIHLPFGHGKHAW